MSIAILAKNASGQPLAGLSPTWSTYRDAETGLTQTAPGITALSGGLYKFDPIGNNPVGIIDLGSTASPRYLVYTGAVPFRVFAAFDSVGAPLPSLTPTWTTLVRVDTGAAYTQPAITAVGGGLYKTSLYTGIHLTGSIDLGATAYPRYFQYDSELLDGTYMMRAYKTTPTTGHVYWTSPDGPDLTGDLSGYTPGDLTDILIMGVVPTEETVALIKDWTAGSYGPGEAVTRGPYLWRANLSTTEDPLLVEGNLGSNTDWAVQTTGGSGMVQTPGASDGAPDGKVLLINNVLSSSTTAYRQSVNSGFLGKMLVVDLQISGTADWLYFGVFDSTQPQTASDLLAVPGNSFFGANIFIYTPSTAKIEFINDGAPSANVAYSNAFSTNAGSAFSRWYLKMLQNGSNWDLELLRDAAVAGASPYTGFDPDQVDALIPIARFLNVARPSYTNWRFVVGARTGGSAGIFSCRAAYVRDIVSGAWTALSRRPIALP